MSKLMNMKLSEIYSKIFNDYLNSSPNYRRELLTLEKLYKWYKELDIRNSLNVEEDFYILMEWFNAVNLIKPFCVVQFPIEHPYRRRWSGDNILYNFLDESVLNKLQEENILIFPEAVYDIDGKLDSDVTFWKHESVDHVVEHELEGNKAQVEKFICKEETLYLYHPIQFFQVLIYLRGSGYEFFYSKKAYKKFYWPRRVKFDDWIIKHIKESLIKDNKTIEDFIDHTPPARLSLQRRCFEKNNLAFFFLTKRSKIKYVSKHRFFL